ncbi:MAG: T9SS type A sorting domain-containing protein, partial [Bacteroidia bacterium]
SKIYPNPAIEELSIYISNVEVEGNYVLTIYDMLGQECEVVDLESVEYQKVNGLSALKGMYIYQLRNGEELVLDGKVIMGY